MKLETATFGAGCFWCIETIFSRLKGVSKAVSGYSGGDKIDPTYEEICTGATNHAEVVQISYDADEISFETLLTVLFEIHDPTTLNRQGGDVGTQYRSVIYFHSAEQQQQAIAKIQQIDASKMHENPVVTEVTAAQEFYSAESYHQNYFENNQDNKYCQLVVAQKVQKFLKAFSHLLKAETA